jgi:hypothetical protein
VAVVPVDAGDQRGHFDTTWSVAVAVLAVWLMVLKKLTVGVWQCVSRARMSSKVAVAWWQWYHSTDKITAVRMIQIISQNSYKPSYNIPFCPFLTIFIYKKPPKKKRQKILKIHRVPLHLATMSMAGQNLSRISLKLTIEGRMCFFMPFLLEKNNFIYKNVKKMRFFNENS